MDTDGPAPALIPAGDASSIGELPAQWPPPGLERLQGDLWTLTVHLAAGGAAFTFPLLTAITVEQDFWSLGFLGEAWWVLLVTTVVGLVILLSGFVELFRLLRRWSIAADQGYHHRTVLTVLSDRLRDSGFVLQGRAAYSLLPERRRASLLARRRLSSVLMLAGALWLSLGFVAGVLLAARGLLGPAALAWWTLAPAATATLLVAVSGAVQVILLRRARRAWYKEPWARDLEGGAINAWHDDLQARTGAVPIDIGAPGGGTSLRWVAAGSLLLPAFALLAGVPLLMIAGLGPTLAQIAVPSYSRTQQKAARAIVLRDYRLPPDPGITALEAGEAMVALASVNGTTDSPLARSPVRTYDRRFFPQQAEDHGGPTGMIPPRWASELAPQLRDGLSPEVVAYLEEIGSHPALAELETLARAEDLDETGAMWVSPLPPDALIWQLPIPRFSGMREAAYARVGSAIAAAARGRDDEAVRILREVISAGLLLGEDGNTLIANLIGYVIADQGAEALVSMYEASGRTEEARRLRAGLEAVDQAAGMAQVGFRSTPVGALSGMLGAVTDPEALRGLRWDLFITLSSLGPCINLNRAVFGPGEEFERWIDEARTSLVQNPGDAQVFDLARRGWFGSREPGEAGIPGRWAALVLADSGPGSCAVAFRDLR